MASFESKASLKSVSDAEVHKFTIRRLEPSIQRFLKVIEIDIDRLHKHRLNIEKFSRIEDWHGLNQEQINASRTVQQIKANVKEIEKTRKQIIDDDLKQFDEKTENMKQMAVAAVMEFVNINISEEDTGNEQVDADQTSKERDPLMGLPTSFHGSFDLSSQSLPETTDSYQLQLHSIPENSEALQSWEELQESLIELNTMVHEFASAVESQQEQIDKIEDNIEKAHDGVRQGTIQLGKASKYKAAIFPIAGALIGTVVAGPFGLIAGAKIGGVAGAVSGGVLGYASGAFIKKRKDKITELEMKNLSAKRSNSVPDINIEKDRKSSWLPWR